MSEYTIIMINFFTLHRLFFEQNLGWVDWLIKVMVMLLVFINILAGVSYLRSKIFFFSTSYIKKWYRESRYRHLLTKYVTFFINIIRDSFVIKKDKFLNNLSEESKDRYLQIKMVYFAFIKRLKVISLFDIIWYYIGFLFLILGINLRNCFFKYRSLEIKVKKIFNLYLKGTIYSIFYILFFFVDFLEWLYKTCIWYIRINIIQVIFVYNSRIRDKFILWPLGDYSHLSFKQELKLEKIKKKHSLWLQRLEASLVSLKFRFISITWKLVLFLPLLKIFLVKRYYISLSEKIFTYWGFFFDKLETPLLEALSYKISYLGGATAADIFKGKVNILHSGQSQGFLQEQLYSKLDHWGMNIISFPEHIDNEDFSNLTTYFMDTRYTEAEQIRGDNKLAQEVWDAKIKAVSKLNSDITRCSNELINVIPKPFDRDSFYHLLKTYSEMELEDISQDEKLKLRELFYSGDFGAKFMEYKRLLNLKHKLESAEIDTLVKAIKELKGSDMLERSYGNDHELQEYTNLIGGYRDPINSVEDLNLAQELLYWVKLPFTVFTLFSLVLFFFIIFSRHRKYVLNAPEYFGASFKAKLNGALIYFMFLTGMEYFVFRFILFVFLRLILMVYINVYDILTPMYDLSYELPVIESILPKQTLYTTLGESEDNIIIGQNNVFVDFDESYYLDQDKKLLSYYEDMLRLFKLRHRIPQYLSKDLEDLTLNKSQLSLDFFSKKSHLQSFLQQRSYLLPSSPLIDGWSIVSSDELGGHATGNLKVSSFEEKFFSNSAMYLKGSSTKNLYSVLQRDLVDSKKIKLGDINPFMEEVTFRNNLRRNFILMSHTFKDCSPEVTERVQQYYKMFNESMLREDPVILTEHHNKFGQKIINSVDCPIFYGGFGIQWDTEDFFGTDMFEYEEEDSYNPFFENPGNRPVRWNSGLPSIFDTLALYKVKFFPIKNSFEVRSFYSSWGFVTAGNSAYVVEDLFGLPFDIIKSGDVLGKKLVSSEIITNVTPRGKSSFSEFSNFYNLLKDIPACRNLVISSGVVYNPDKLEDNFFAKCSTKSADAKYIIGERGYIKDLGEFYSRRRDLEYGEQAVLDNVYEEENNISLFRGLPVGEADWLSSAYANLCLEDAERLDRGNFLFGNIAKDITSENKDILMLNYEYRKQMLKNLLIYYSGNSFKAPSNYFSTTCNGIEKYYNMAGVTDCYNNKKVGYFIGGLGLQKKIVITHSLQNVVLNGTFNSSFFSLYNQFLKYFGNNLNIYENRHINININNASSVAPDYLPDKDENINININNASSVAPDYLPDEDDNVSEYMKFVCKVYAEHYEIMLDEFRDSVDELDGLHYLKERYLIEQANLAEDDNDLVDIEMEIAGKRFETELNKLTINHYRASIPEEADDLIKDIIEKKNMDEYFSSVEDLDVSDSKRDYRELSLHNIIENELVFLDMCSENIKEALQSTPTEAELKDLVLKYKVTAKLVSMFNSFTKDKTFMSKAMDTYYRSTIMEQDDFDETLDNEQQVIERCKDNYKVVNKQLSVLKEKFDGINKVRSKYPNDPRANLKYDLHVTIFDILEREKNCLVGILGESINDIQDDNSVKDNSVNDNSLLQIVSDNAADKTNIKSKDTVTKSSGVVDSSKKSEDNRILTENQKSLKDTMAEYSSLMERRLDLEDNFAKFLKETEDPLLDPKFELFEKSIKQLAKAKELYELKIEALRRNIEVDKESERSVDKLISKLANEVDNKPDDEPSARSVYTHLYAKEINHLNAEGAKTVANLEKAYAGWRALEASKTDANRAAITKEQQECYIPGINAFNEYLYELNETVKLYGENNIKVQLNANLSEEQLDLILLDKKSSNLKKLCEKYPQFKSLQFNYEGNLLLQQKEEDKVIKLKDLQQQTCENLLELVEKDPDNTLYKKYYQEALYKLRCTEEILNQFSCAKNVEESSERFYVLKHLENEKFRLKLIADTNMGDLKAQHAAADANLYYISTGNLIKELKSLEKDRPYGTLSKMFTRKYDMSHTLYNSKYTIFEMQRVYKDNESFNEFERLRNEHKNVVKESIQLTRKLKDANGDVKFNEKLVDLHVKKKILRNKVRNIVMDLDNSLKEENKK